MKEITPTKQFYDTFRLYKLDAKCPTCKQIIKSKRPNVKFYLLKESKGEMWSVKQSNLKNARTFHKSYFNPLYQMDVHKTK